MKRAVCVAALLGLVAVFSAWAFAGEGATKEECIAKCKEVARLAKEKGRDAAIAAVKNRQGPFVWKDTYVFLVDTSGVVLAHPIKPALEGKNVMHLRDVRGKMFVAEYVNLANSKGKGWVEYMWPKPGEKKPVPKMTYVYKVPGMNLIALAGIYK